MSILILQMYNINGKSQKTHNNHYMIMHRPDELLSSLGVAPFDSELINLWSFSLMLRDNKY